MPFISKYLVIQMTKIEKRANLNSDRSASPVFNSYILKICSLFNAGSKK